MYCFALLSNWRFLVCLFSRCWWPVFHFSCLSLQACKYDHFPSKILRKCWIIFFTHQHILPTNSPILITDSQLKLKKNDDEKLVTLSNWIWFEWEERERKKFVNKFENSQLFSAKFNSENENNFILIRRNWKWKINACKLKLAAQNLPRNRRISVPNCGMDLGEMAWTAAWRPMWELECLSRKRWKYCAAYLPSSGWEGGNSQKVKGEKRSILSISRFMCSLIRLRAILAVSTLVHFRLCGHVIAFLSQKWRMNNKTPANTK